MTNAMEKVMLCYATCGQDFTQSGLQVLCGGLSGKITNLGEEWKGKGKGDEGGVTNCKADRGRSQPARSHQREHGVPDVPKGYQRAPNDT